MSAMLPSRRPVRSRLLGAVLALVLSSAGAGAAAVPARAAVSGSPSAAAPGPGAVAEPTAGQPVLVVAPWSAGILAPGSEIVVTVAVENTADAPLPAGSAVLRLARDAVDDVDEWTNRLDGAQPGAMVDIAHVDVPPVDGRAQLEFRLPADAAFGERGWGGYPIEVEYRAGEAVSTAVSALTWTRDSGPAPAPVALTIPLTVPASRTGLIESSALERYTSASGMLTRRLDAAAASGATVALDPMIVASIRVLGADAPPSAAAWLERLDALAVDSFGLTYADADPEAMARVTGSILTPEGFGAALDPAAFSSAPLTPAVPQPTPSPAPPTATPAPSPSPDPGAGEGATALPTTEELLAWEHTLQGVVWPDATTIGPAGADALRAAGASTLLVSTANVASAGPHVQLGELDALVSDSTLSALLDAAVWAQGQQEWDSAMARLTSALAASAHEGPVLLTLDRGRAAPAVRLGATLDVLRSLDWIDLGGAGPLLGLPAEPAALRDGEAPGPRATDTRSLIEAHLREQAFASVAADPRAVTAPRRLRLLALLSLSWPLQPDAWAEERSEYLQESAELRSSVQLVETSQINILSDRERLPVSISNDLPVPVTVTVHVRSTSPELLVREPVVQVTVEPQSTARQLVIPVRSLANGRVTILLSLTSATGEPIGEPTSVVVNVRADWGTALLAGLVAVVVVLLVVGVYRTARRLRARTARAGGSPDPQPGDAGD